MSNLSWKMKRFFQKPLNVVLAAVVAWFGYSMYKYGALSRGVGPAFTRTARQVPVLGSYFKNNGRSYGRYYGRSYGRGKRSYGRRSAYHSRRHYGRKHSRRYRR